ncbi:MAG: inositol monophosphatase family protein [Albidovulum sp.]|nr:inositol monophosphatase family protein [Albidovulum sp.]
MNSVLASELESVALELADAARTSILPFFRQESLTVDNKAEASWDPVTEADRQAEKSMRAILSNRRPDDGILGEEFEPVPSASGLTWVLDPIDGTRGFLCGAPTWGVLIAVSSESGPIFGIVDQPYIGERFAGGFGKCWMEGPLGRRDLRARSGKCLEQATLATTYPAIGTEAECLAFRRLADRALLVRYGLDCYAYALLAAGQIDLIVEAGLKPFDVHAPIALVRAAGGIVTDWKGREAHGGGRLVAAATESLHALALAELGDV